MLKYKLNIKDKQNKVIEVKYDALYLSKDASYLTGITDPSYCLADEDSVIVVSNEAQRCNLRAENVMCCGYVLLNETYKVQDFGNTIGILYMDGLYYCVNKEDYGSKEESVISKEVLGQMDSSLIVPFITINNKDYKLAAVNDKGELVWKEEIQIPTKYWSFDNKITIHDIVYDVIIENKTYLENKEAYYPYIILNDNTLSDEERILYVIDWEYSKRHLVTKFTIQGKFDSPLITTNAYCVKQYNYFDAVVDGVNKRHYVEEYANFDEFLSDMMYKYGTIASEWKLTNKSNVIDLYVKDDVSEISNGCKLFVKSVGSSVTLRSDIIENGEIVFTYYGKLYKCNTNNTREYVIINNVEYQIYSIIQYGTPTRYYIIFDGTPLTIEKKGNTANIILPSYYGTPIKFDIKEYYYIEIDNKRYNVYEKDNLYCVDLDFVPYLELKLVNVFSSNVLRCAPYNNEDYSSLFSSMANGIQDFIVYVNTPIFDISWVSPITKEERDYVASDLKLFVNHESFIVPIKLEADTALNLHKDYIIKENYANKKKEEFVNRIVDMEKDVYYPAYLTKKGNKDEFTLCHKIQIDLHFRTRDLSTWTVNDENNLDNTSGLYPSNWNIFDHYRYPNDNNVGKSLQPKLILKDDLQYYPPSDLLYFLNFKDDDVFYQKQKIGKSFLRLSFYDSPNPNNQSLLYSSTIFMSETELYKKYINADKTLTHYITLKDRSVTKESFIANNGDNNDTTQITKYTVNDSNKVKRIGVSTEPCDEKGSKLTFDENKRLSSSFVIKNRNECVDSSDGFYLYLFKEYSNWTHERSIYMRVQFNHAGLGRTVNFMQLFHNNNGNKSMINWATKFNFDKYKDGCSLKDLYDHIFIEIKVKYDLENKRFCYYLPEWMSEKNSDKNVFRLSLFEIKIKDESQ